MSYNIKDFWLRFDGEPETITSEGAVLDRDDLEKLEIIAAVINEKKPDVIDEWIAENTVEEETFEGIPK